MKIEYVSHGLGNNFGDVIEINRNLIYYPELYNIVLKHELEHSDKIFSLKDLKLDLTQKANSWDMLKFMFKHPKSFSQLLPFYYSRKHGFVYDINLILIYCFLIGLILLTSFIAVHI